MTVESYLSERQELLEQQVKKLVDQIGEMNEVIAEQEQEIIRLNEKVVKAENQNTQGQLDELRKSVEVLEADEVDTYEGFQHDVAKSIEEIHEVFRNNDIRLVQDDSVMKTLYGRR